MKLTTNHNKKTKGMTLLELTVVILVLLSLISILFIGARAWKKGSDRSANVLNLRNTQQAMRGHQNMYTLVTGDAFTAAMLADYMPLPTPPVDTVTYTPVGTVTAVGALWLGPNAAGDEGGDYGPEVGATADW